MRRSDDHQGLTREQDGAAAKKSSASALLHHGHLHFEILPSSLFCCILSLTLSCHGISFSWTTAPPTIFVMFLLLPPNSPQLFASLRMLLKQIHKVPVSLELLVFSETDRFCFRFFFTLAYFFLWCVSLTRLVTSLRVILMQQPTNSSANRDINKSSEFHIELILLGDEVDTFKFYVSSGEIFWHALIVNSTPALDIWNS